MERDEVVLVRERDIEVPGLEHGQRVLGVGLEEGEVDAREARGEGTDGGGHEREGGASERG